MTTGSLSQLFSLSEYTQRLTAPHPPENGKELTGIQSDQILHVDFAFHLDGDLVTVHPGLTHHTIVALPGCPFWPVPLHRRHFHRSCRFVVTDNASGNLVPAFCISVAVLVAEVCPSIRS